MKFFYRSYHFYSFKSSLNSLIKYRSNHFQKSTNSYYPKDLKNQKVIIKRLKSTSIASSSKDLLTDDTKSFQSSPQFFGQPLPTTHPHLLKPHQLTIGIDKDEYAQRRKKLMDRLEPGSAVIIAGARTKWMAHHVFYPFRQLSDFWYLTGFQEPDSCLVLEKDNSQKGYTMTLFVRPKDPSTEMWEGARTGIEGVLGSFGADQAFDISELAHRLRPLLTKPTDAPLYLDLPADIQLLDLAQSTSSLPLMDFFSKSSSQYSDLVGSLTSSIRNSPFFKSDLEACLAVLATTQSNRSQRKTSRYRPIRSLQAKLDPIKMIKSNAELRLLRIAADISAYGFKAAMQSAAQSTPWDVKSEHDLVQVFETACHSHSPSHGGRMGYVPVCAAGHAALTIHYTYNDRALDPGRQMVLLDAGYEYAGYVADITRTFPVGNGGQFSPAQKDLYEVVKGVEKHLIGLCQESSGESLRSLHHTSCSLLKDGLNDLGFNLRNFDDLQTLYPHYIGHPVGTDLHDTPTWNRSNTLKAGSVITIEPGIYVPDHDKYPSAFHGIGIRIEDMIHIREKDSVILSCNTPKEVVDVEACASGFLNAIKKL
ncbi:hypothetical protein O181_058232 [Austropuccinia psidii MF-1]|uniref:Aminopeptidase P N-terminal domain-containing protein n=1 Tax=Austropuccinia psidii MF-1 TaxID=1389203 RepID=A0A9Q3HW86_9BASI|nr:hypothetical protein [Austropuccinia psidii MF-1]